MNEPAKDLVLTMTKQELLACVQDALNKAAATPPKEVLDMKEAAELFDVHTTTLMRKLVRERGCPVHYIGPQDPRFRRSELIEWLTNQPKEPTHGGS